MAPSPHRTEWKSKVRVRNLVTAKEVICDVLSRSRFTLRVVPDGSREPFTMTRRRERGPYAYSLGEMMLETVDADD